MKTSRSPRAGCERLTSLSTLCSPSGTGRVELTASCGRRARRKLTTTSLPFFLSSTSRGLQEAGENHWQRKRGRTARPSLRVYEQERRAEAPCDTTSSHMRAIDPECAVFSQLPGLLLCAFAASLTAPGPFSPSGHSARRRCARGPQNQDPEPDPARWDGSWARSSVLIRPLDRLTAAAHEMRA